MWTTREEDILAYSLLELVAKGWKSDNGFRAGYLGRIKEHLREEFPKTDLKGTPTLPQRLLDSSVKTMRNKAWPYWDPWIVIFGKDCAIGTGAEDVADGAQAVRQQNVVETWRIY
ncbi:hypothetical protein SASPL_148718 [Salvia splendens]|uniref:Uncharacterized protein n=1 Tax=Salvia splendens TaxID=180675 RepID=A0A8X8Z3N0_SALSN|nr:hypothetical protein SASPL_148718 [Salvia splendens]